MPRKMYVVLDLMEAGKQRHLQNFSSKRFPRFNSRFGRVGMWHFRSAKFRRNPPESAAGASSHFGSHYFSGWFSQASVRSTDQKSSKLEYTNQCQAIVWQHTVARFSLRPYPGSFLSPATALFLRIGACTAGSASQHHCQKFVGAPYCACFGPYSSYWYFETKRYYQSPCYC